MKSFSATGASLVLLSVMSLILASATLAGQHSEAAASFLYHNPVTIVLWILMVFDFFRIRSRYPRGAKIPFGSTLLHVSFVVMLTGAFITMTTETEGHLYLERGQSKGMIIRSDGHPVGIPFTVGLDSLVISRYPGTGNPSGFTSYVTIVREGAVQETEVSVNHPLRVSGWRLYQASYDPQKGATVLQVVRDPWGTTVSYIGYFLFFIAFMMLFFSPDSRFSRLRRRLSALGCSAVLFMAGAGSAYAWQKPDADKVSWDEIVAQDAGGRIVTLDTYCRELMRKIHHDEQWGGLSSVESVIRIMSEPESVYDIPFIYQKNSDVAALIGQQEGRLASFSSLLEADGSYRLARFVEQALSVPSRQRSRFDKDILKLDEKANLLYSVVQGTHLAVFPVRDHHDKKWLSPGDDISYVSVSDSAFIRTVTSVLLTEPSQEAVDVLRQYQLKCCGQALPDEIRISQELLCNRIRPFRTGAMGYMCCAVLLLAASLLLGRKKFLTWAVFALSVLVLLLHSWGIWARWYCSGQPPLSNSYEVTVFLSWCTALISLILFRRSAASSAFGLLLSGALLLVAGMNSMDPAITPLVPVLQSPWLMFHVAVIMAGYACFGINFLLSVYNLAAMSVCGESSPAVQKTTLLVEIFAIVGLMLMTLGTFLGAVWAGESWGTYWSWDPKETWALITILVYAIATHARMVKRLDTPKWLCIFSIIGLLCVLMTYFGVNWFLTGMHSYA